MLQTLFSSRVRAKILKNFFLSPGTSYNISQLTKTLDENYSAVWKELLRLEKAGILSHRSDANSKIYSVDLNCPIEPELRRIVLKTEGLGETICSKINKLGDLDTVFIYGSFASGEADTQSDIDLMLIGKIEINRFAPLIAQLEKELGRQINYTIFTKEEWASRIVSEDTFTANVMASPKIILIGDEHAF